MTHMVFHRNSDNLHNATSIARVLFRAGNGVLVCQLVNGQGQRSVATYIDVIFGSRTVIKYTGYTIFTVIQWDPNTVIPSYQVIATYIIFTLILFLY